VLQTNIAAGPGHPKFWIPLRKSYIKPLRTQADLLLLHLSINRTLLPVNHPEKSPKCLPYSPSLPRSLLRHSLRQLIQFLVSPFQPHQLRPHRLLLDQILLRSTLKQLAMVELDVLKEVLEVSYQLIDQRMLTSVPLFLQRLDLTA